MNTEIDNFQQKLKEIFIEGLKRKGFEFEDMAILEDFIKLNCSCRSDSSLNQITYYVNDIPFLVHGRMANFDSNIVVTDKCASMIANYGNYAYL